MTRPALSVLAHSDAYPSKGLIQLLSGGLLAGLRKADPEQLRCGLDFANPNALGLGYLVDAGIPGLAAPILEHRLAECLCQTNALTFASGPGAVRAILATLLQPGDDILVDAAAPPAMFETIPSTGANLHRVQSGSIEAVERRLQRLSRHSGRGRLVIAVPAVSPHSSRIADLADLADLARRHGAVLVVDVSQDFGLMGQNGAGVLELQNCLDRADIVLGSFSRGFGTDGGFAAFRDPALLLAARGAARLSDAKARTILAASEIVFSPIGTSLRRKLMGLSLRLRNHLLADGARVLGSASPFVPVLLPALTALPRTALLESGGPRVSLLMAPLVPAQAPRWRIELNARHSMADIDDLAELIRDVTRAFDRQPRRLPVTA